MLDMMPTDPTILGFGASAWFQNGFEAAKHYRLPNAHIIQAFDALHLIAAKIEAYQDRGHQDWMTSRDVEDIVTLLDGRSKIFEELSGDQPVHHFVRRWLSSFDEEERLDVLATHVSDYARASYLELRLDEIL